MTSIVQHQCHPRLPFSFLRNFSNFGNDVVYLYVFAKYSDHVVIQSDLVNGRGKNNPYMVGCIFSQCDNITFAWMIIPLAIFSLSLTVEKLPFRRRCYRLCPLFLFSKHHFSKSINDVVHLYVFLKYHVTIQSNHVSKQFSEYHHIVGERWVGWSKNMQGTSEGAMWMPYLRTLVW